MLLQLNIWHLLMYLQGSPATPVNYNPNSAASNPSPSWPLPEESGSVVDLMYDGGSISHLGDFKFLLS